MPELDRSRTVAYLCPHCRQTVIAERTLFALAAEPARIPCPCGKSALELELGPVRARLRVPCPFCRGEHEVQCASSDLAGERTLVFSCAASGIVCCAVGQKGQVYDAAARMEQAADRLEREQELPEGEKQAFLDGVVMQEVLSELKTIAGRNGIGCACGSRAWGFQVNYASVDLFCRSCGARLRIPAATADDLDDLCCKMTLEIRGKGK